MPPGALALLILRVLRSGTLHGYAIAQRIHALSSDVLRVEEGSLYPALQRILLKGWVTLRVGHLRDQPQGALLPADRRRPQAARSGAVRLRPRQRGDPVGPAHRLTDHAMN